MGQRAARIILCVMLGGFPAIPHAQAGSGPSVTIVPAGTCRIGSNALGLLLRVPRTTCRWTITYTGNDTVTLTIERLPWDYGQDTVNHFLGESDPDSAGPLSNGDSFTLSQDFTYGPTLSSHTVTVQWGIFAGGSSVGTLVRGTLTHDATCDGIVVQC